MPVFPRLHLRGQAPRKRGRVAGIFPRSGRTCPRLDQREAGSADTGRRSRGSLCPQMWIPAFAGMTVAVFRVGVSGICRRSRGSGNPGIFMVEVDSRICRGHGLRGTCPRGCGRMTWRAGAGQPHINLLCYQYVSEITKIQSNSTTATSGSVWRLSLPICRFSC